MNDSKPLEQVGIGVHVDLELISESGQREPMSLDIVPDKSANLEQGLLGAGTPLAKAILGKRVGSTLPYKMGDIHSVQIIRAHRIVLNNLENMADQRKTAIDKALEAVERTNAEIFASSFTSKWGGYDAPSDTDWTKKAE